MDEMAYQTEAPAKDSETLEESAGRLVEILEKGVGLLREIMDSNEPSVPSETKSLEPVPRLGLGATLGHAQNRADMLIRKLQTMHSRVGRL